VSDKPFPPSARRLALARQAGLTAASPMLVAGLVCAAIAIVVAVGRFALGDAIAAACTGTALLPEPRALVTWVLGLALPIVGAAAIAATAAHIAQTRAWWMPRRRITNAPALDRGALSRTRGTAFDLLAVTVIAAVSFGWLWSFAPRLAVLFELTPGDLLRASCALGASFVAALSIAYLCLGVVDAVARQIELAGALAMTATEKREDDRLTSADPRWARHRALLARDTAHEGAALAAAVAGCALVIVGDDLAIAIAWDATKRPIPTRIAIGRRARATQLIGLARRHRIAVHREPDLARALGDGEGPVPEARWRALAEVLAALHR
jgi:flagellar biosynthesis protein FlhB